MAVMRDANVRALMTVALVCLLTGSAEAGTSTLAGRAVWPTDVAVDTGPRDLGIGSAFPPGIAIVGNGAEGVIIVWEDRTQGKIFAQRVDGRGTVLWRSGGVPVPGETIQMSPVAIGDGAGGAIVAWIEGRDGFCNQGFMGECDIYAQRLSADGDVLWNDTGVPVTTADANQGTSGIALANDGSGGIVLAWEDARPSCCKHFAQRLDSQGTPLWTVNGVQVSPEPTFVFGPAGAPRIASDGSGGAFIAWPNQQLSLNTSLAVQRVSSAGEVLFDLNGTILFPLLRLQFDIVAAGDGSAIVASIANLTSVGWGSVAAQRVDAEGNARWTPNGVVLSPDTSIKIGLDADDDGRGGAVVVWDDQRNQDPMITGGCGTLIGNCDIFAQRVDASGTPLWTEGGVAVSAAPGNQTLPRVVADASGGAVFAWQDCRRFVDNVGCDFGRDIFVQRVGPDGEPLWTPDGVLVSAADNNQGVDYGTQAQPSFAMAGDGGGGAILAWPDGRVLPCARTVGAPTCDVYAQRVSDTAGRCHGDCDGLGAVTVDEIIRAVNIALGLAELSDCSAADVNHDGVVTVDEVIAAVNRALTGCPASPAPTPPPLQQPTVQTHPAGARPTTLSSADFDGDGNLDLAVTSLDRVLVLLGDGTGGFGDAPDVMLGAEAVAAGDLDGDAVADLAVPNERRNNQSRELIFDVSVLRGLGNGSFGNERRFAVGTRPAAIIIADLNGDARPDLVTANEESHDVSVLLGTGGGDFASERRFSVGWQPVSVAVADLNDDGIDDLVTANNNSDDVSVLLGTGGGEFEAESRHSVGFGLTASPASVAVGDLDADGHPDLVTANEISLLPASSGGFVSILMGNGDGSFADAWAWYVGGNPASVVVADLNGDGALDLATANPRSDDVWVLRGNGDGTFFPIDQRFPVGQWPLALLAEDFDGDNGLDLVVANSLSRNISVLSAMQTQPPGGLE
jgi:hypothetical protein